MNMKLLAELSKYTTFEVSEIGQAPLYRGGETDQTGPVAVRRGNLFLSRHNNTAESYAKFWMMKPFGYVYRAMPMRSLRVVTLSSMQSFTRFALDALEIPARSANTWQRDALLNLVRSGTETSVDAILFEADGNSELILDNREGLLTIEDQAIFPRSQPDREAIARVLQY
jgi:hypothetical protein